MAAAPNVPIDYAAIVQPYMPVFYASFLVSIILTPFMRILAHRHGVVDDPDNKRKVHTQPIAYLGGVAVFAGWLAGIGVTVFLRPHNAVGDSPNVQIPIGILLGASAVVIFGFMDDVFSLSAPMKLMGQIIAASLLVLPGFLPVAGNDPFISGGGEIAGVPIHPGPAWRLVDALQVVHVLPAQVPAYIFAIVPFFSALIAIAIIVSACNATNLLDGLDGLCSGVTCLISVGYLILAIYIAHMGITDANFVDPVRICLCLALLGSLLGFIPFNFNPASIFLGDTGSMFLGFMCGTMMLLFGHSGPIKFFLAAIVMFGLPMMDTLLAIVRRRLTGRSIFSPDSNHFHHFLIRNGFTVKRAVLLAYLVAIIFVSFGLVVIIIPTKLGFGVYLVLFGWIIVAAFKMGMIFQNAPAVAANTSLNLSVITPVAPTTKPPVEAKLPTETIAAKPAGEAREPMGAGKADSN